MVLHRTSPVDQQWHVTMAALWQHLDPNSALGLSSVPAHDCDTDMESGVEITPPCFVDIMIRDLAPDMDICEPTGFAGAGTVTPAAPFAGNAFTEIRDAKNCRLPSPDEACPAARKAYRARY